MWCVYALVLLSVISGTSGSDICNGVDCHQCVNLDQCLYIRRFRGPNSCIKKSEIHDFRFKAIISDPEKCGVDIELKDAKSPIESTTTQPTVTERRSASHSITLTPSESSTIATTSAIPTPYRPARTPEQISTPKYETDDAILAPRNKDYINANRTIFAHESSSTTERITANTSTAATQEKNIPSNFTMKGSPPSSSQPNPPSEHADLLGLDIFSFTVPDKFDCNSSDMKIKIHYPIAIRAAFNMCRATRLLQKLQLKTSLTKDLSEWITHNPAHDHERQCAYLIYYKRNCGRKFA